MELLQKNIVDVVCAEHFGAFEWSKNQSTGSVDPAAVRAWLDLLDAAAQTNGSVFIKTWPGPETVRKTAFVLEFSLCLSRACLGKMFVFIYKWLKNAVLRRLQKDSTSTHCDR